MQELLRNAVNGWIEYTDAGKYAVLFLGVLMCYWYRLACAGQRKGQPLMIYASIMAIAVIFPPTAVILMKYQTGFYDYKWLWSVVPVTPVIAWGAAGLYLDIYRSRFRGKLLKPAGLAAMGLAVIFLCGNLNIGGCEGTDTADSKAGTAKLLDNLEEAGNTEDICLWAPREIMAHIRGLSGEIRLLYGRNMWDVALNAYAYDVYDPETVALYEWMEGLAADEGSDLTEEAELAACVVIETALNKGVNCIVIPEEVTDKISAFVTDVAEEMNFSVTIKDAEGYYIYRIRS